MYAHVWLLLPSYQSHSMHRSCLNRIMKLLAYAQQQGAVFILDQPRTEYLWFPNDNKDSGAEGKGTCKASSFEIGGLNRIGNLLEKNRTERAWACCKRTTSLYVWLTIDLPCALMQSSRVTRSLHLWNHDPK